MELKEFIKTAITDITEAISELQGELSNGAIVSPPMSSSSAELTTIDIGGANCPISNIDFDVAITVGNTGTINGKAKAGIQIFSAKISGGNEVRTENVSRMTFSVPIKYPTAKIQMDHELASVERKEKLRASRPNRPLAGSVVISSAEGTSNNQSIHNQ